MLSHSDTSPREVPQSVGLGLGLGFVYIGVGPLDTLKWCCNPRAKML